jgi:hypothetical protein
MTTLTRYSYSSFQKIRIYFFLIIFGVVMIAMLFGFLRLIVASIFGSNLPVTTSPNIDQQLAGLALTILFIGFGIALFANFEPDIQVADDGLYVQAFIFWWIFVPWADIETIRPTLTSYVLRNSPHIVIVKRLTPIHRFISCMYAFSLKPGFLIRRRIERFDELLKIIKDKVAHNPDRAR